MRKLIIFLMAGCFFSLSVLVNAVEYKTLKIKQITINSETADVNVQTIPDISTLNSSCVNPAGFFVPKDNIDGYKVTLSALLSAQSRGANIDVLLDDFGQCKLVKLTVKSS